jgi:hypothetical protein
VFFKSRSGDVARVQESRIFYFLKAVFSKAVAVYDFVTSRLFSALPSFRPSFPSFLNS